MNNIHYNHVEEILRGISNKNLEIMRSHKFTKITKIISNRLYSGLSNYTCEICNYDAATIFWYNFDKVMYGTYNIGLATPISCNDCIIKNIIE